MLQRVIDLIFPPICVSCDRPFRWICQQHLNDLCWNYAQPIDGWIYSALEYHDSAQAIVKAVKYGRYYCYTKLMAQLTAIRLPNFASQHRIAALIPVPLHPKKRKWRGYNQAELYAKHLGQIWKLPVLTNVLVRQKHAAAQASLNKTDRQKIKHSFKAVTTLSLTKVCLIDDVTTTGSTLSACKEALEACSQIDVLAISFAREQ